jgi:hypothetical protein
MRDAAFDIESVGAGERNGGFWLAGGRDQVLAG